MLLCAVMLFGMIPAVSAETENETVTATARDNDVSVSGTNSFGNLLSQEFAKAQDEAAADAANFSGNYSVIGLTFEGNVATVKYHSMEEANLIVAVYTEDTMQLLASGYAVVSPDEQSVNVTIEGAMPQYFMAAAYLVDSFDYSPLCPAFDTPMYTKDMQELLASTVADYDAERVLNMDDSLDNNFGVYKDSVVIIEGGEGINTVAGIDYENNTYVIENADEQITSLTAGTIISYPWAAADVLIVKIGDISVDGTTATITGADLAMTEVFDCLKLDTTGDPEEMVVDPSSCAEGVTFEGIETESKPATRAWEDDFTAARTINHSLYWSLGMVTVTGSVGLNIDVACSYYISWKRQTFQFNNDVELELALTISGTLADVEIPMSKIKIATPVPGVVIDIVPALVLEASVGVTVVATIGSTVGFNYDSKSKKKFKNLSKPIKVTPPECKLIGEIFLGVKLSADVALADEFVAGAGVEARIGALISGELQGIDFEGEPKANAAARHDCRQCIDGQIDGATIMSASISLLDFLEDGFSKTDSYKIMDFYVHLDSGELEFFEGDCPNYLYRTTFDVWDGNSHEQLAGAVITADSGEEWGVTNENGVFVTYLKPGKYKVTITAGEETLEKSFKVKKEAHSVDVKIGGTTISVDAIVNGVFQVIDQIVDVLEITDKSEKEIVKATSIETGVPYKFGAYCTGLANTYYMDGNILGSYAGATTDWDGAVDFYFEEAANGYYMYFIDSAGVKKYFTVGTAETYGYFIFSETPSSVFTWDSTYGIPVSVVDGITWFAGMHSPYEDFFMASVSNIAKHDVAYLFTLGDGIPDGALPQTKKPETRGVFGGEYGTQETESYVIKTAYFKDMVPNQEYLLLALNSLNAEAPAEPANVLFVDQAKAQEDGSLVFRYVQREQIQESYVIACGATNQNLRDAEINFPIMRETEVTNTIKPTVTYNGKTLTEELDYTLVGTVDFTKAGTYTCYVRGVNNYTGLVPCTYTVLDQSMVAAWNLTLSDRICANFYLDIADDIKETAVVNITLAGKTTSYPVADSAIDEATGRYVFSVALAATQMTEKITVELVNGENVIDTRSYSVRQYADYVLSEDSGIAENIKNLVREMLNYGGMAQTYFDYNTQQLANEGITGAGKAAVPYGTTEYVIATEPVVGKPFKMAMKVASGAVMYFNGKTESASISYRLGTTANVEEAVDVYLEQASEGKYNLYFMNGSTKTYIRIYQSATGNPGYGKGKVGLVTTVPTEKLHFDAAAKTLVYAYDSNNAYYIGTYSTYTTFSASNTSFITGNNASKVDVSQYPARLYAEETVYNEGFTVTPEGDVPNLKFMGASLVYRDRIAVRYYFVGDVSGCTFTVDGKEYTPIANGGKHYVEVSDITPESFDQKYTLTVTGAAGDSLTVTYGAMNYIIRMGATGSTKLKNLLKALYNYHLAAKAL